MPLRWPTSLGTGEQQVAHPARCAALCCDVLCCAVLASKPWYSWKTSHTLPVSYLLCCAMLCWEASPGKAENMSHASSVLLAVLCCAVLCCAVLGSKPWCRWKISPLCVACCSALVCSAVLCCAELCRSRQLKLPAETGSAFVISPSIHDA